jgi:hypothetical protein
LGKGRGEEDGKWVLYSLIILSVLPIILKLATGQVCGVGYVRTYIDKCREFVRKTDDVVGRCNHYVSRILPFCMKVFWIKEVHRRGCCIAAKTLLRLEHVNMLLMNPFRH